MLRMAETVTKAGIVEDAKCDGTPAESGEAGGIAFGVALKEQHKLPRLTSMRRLTERSSQRKIFLAIYSRGWRHFWVSAPHSADSADRARQHGPCRGGHDSGFTPACQEVWIEPGHET